MKKKTAKTTILVLMLLALSLYFIGGTYARYATEFTGEGTTDVAYWNVALKNNGTAVTEDFELALTKAADDYVVADKIAPAATVSGNLALDLNGTEVAVKVSVEVDEDELKDVAEELGIDPDDITAEIELSGGTGSATVEGTAATGYKIKLPSRAAFTSTNGQYTITVKITWTNNENNEEDTTAGKTSGAELTVPITVTVEQLTSAD